MENGSLMEVPLELSAILSTCIKRLKPIFGVCFEWPLKTDFTVLSSTKWILFHVKSELRCE